MFWFFRSVSQPATTLETLRQSFLEPISISTGLKFFNEAPTLPAMYALHLGVTVAKNSMAVGRKPLAVKASASSRHFSSPTMAIFSIC